VIYEVTRSSYLVAVGVVAVDSVMSAPEIRLRTRSAVAALPQEEILVRSSDRPVGDDADLLVRAAGTPQTGDTASALRAAPDDRTAGI